MLPVRELVLLTHHQMTKFSPPQAAGLEPVR
jgi:hypothetical protein